MEQLPQPDQQNWILWALGSIATFAGGVALLLWYFILRVQNGVFDYIEIVKKELSVEDDKMQASIEKQSDQSKNDARDYERRFATKDDVAELKRDVGALQSSMNNQFGSMNTQLAQIITLVSNRGGQG
jgi:hypothetical protein